MTAQRFVFEAKEDFLHKLRELVKNGVDRKAISILTPYPMHEVDEIIPAPESKLKFFSLCGALAGCVFGLAFTIYTSLDWPIIVGGKPIIAIPAFIIIAFEMTLLFGAIASFMGFFLLTRLPSVKYIVSEKEFGKQFVIEVG